MKKYLILLILLNSCASPKLTRNDRGWHSYKTLENPEKVLEVNVSLLPLPPVAKRMPERPRTFFDLRDSVPHTFLKVIGEKASNTEEVIKAIREPLSVVDLEKTTKALVEDYTRFQARFFFSNIKKYYHDRNLMHPNTRLEFLNIYWKLMDESYFSLASIDKIENELEYIDMGTLERVKDVSFGAQLGIEAGMGGGWESGSSEDLIGGNTSNNKNTGNVYDKDGRLLGSMERVNGSTANRSTKNNNSRGINANVGGKAEMKYVNNEMIREAMQIKRMRLKTGFSFSSDKIVISQRGGPLSDISDNVVVTATLKANQLTQTRRVSLFSELFTKEQEINGWKDIDINTSYVKYIQCPAGDIPEIKVTTSYEGAIRSVKNRTRGRHALEYDDKVVYYSFDNPEAESGLIKNQVLEMCQNVYTITAKLFNGPEYTLTDEQGSPILVFEMHNLRALEKWFNQIIREIDIKKFQSQHRYSFRSNNGQSIRISGPDFSAEDLNELKKIRSVGTHIP